MKRIKSLGALALRSREYDSMFNRVVSLIDDARRVSARTVNALVTATYWLIGWHIVEFEQEGKERAEYGEELLQRLAHDLTTKFGRGFSYPNVNKFRQFYLAFPSAKILSTPSIESGQSIVSTASIESRRKSHTASDKFGLGDLAAHFPLPWSAYVRLLSVTSEQARKFYEKEALRGGWSVRQLDRQINSLEFLGLKDEYSESDVEEALILHLERFLLELGGDFAFVGRQRRLRIGDEWYRVDLLFFHRKLRCLVVIDLKRGRFTHGDAGQMHMYLNYAREHWMREGENPPVGLILCSQRDEAIARYALDGLPNKILATEYRTVLPNEKLIAEEIEKTRRHLERRQRLT